MKLIIALIGAAFLSVGIVITSQQVNITDVAVTKKYGIFNQSIAYISTSPHKNYELFKDGKLIGIFRSKEVLKKHLKDIYETRYKQEYPHSSCHLGRGYYLLERKSYELFSDADQQIINYLDHENQYMIQVKAICFEKNGQEYAKIFVKNNEIYENALRQFLSLFIDKSSLKRIQNNQDIKLNHYGHTVTNLVIQEKIRTYRTFAFESEIKKTQKDVFEYLCYGDNKAREYYTVKKGDTIEGVGLLNHGLSAEQVVNLNADKLTYTKQKLKVGDKLNVSYFSSPLNVEVFKKTFKAINIDFKVNYIQDSNLKSGMFKIMKNGKNGIQNSIFEEKWINGVLHEAKEKSTKIIQYPENAVIAIGIRGKKSIGIGFYRAPTDNAVIACHSACYAHHTGLDFIDAYNRFGSVYAADNGIVKENSSSLKGGHYVLIDHQNGYESYYGHLAKNSPLAIGEAVSKGDVIGKIGMSGKANGPYVHFYIKRKKDHKIVDACDGFLDCSRYSQ